MKQRDCAWLKTPDGSKVLLGVGDYYDATSLERLGSISRNFQQGVFMPNGKLAVLAESAMETELAYYDENLAPLPGTVTLQGSPVGLFYSEGVLHAITHDGGDGAVSITTVAVQ